MAVPMATLAQVVALVYHLVTLSTLVPCSHGFVKKDDWWQNAFTVDGAGLVEEEQQLHGLRRKCNPSRVLFKESDISPERLLTVCYL